MAKATDRPEFSIAQPSRSRWNVLDMINIVGEGSIPTCMFSEIDMSWAQSTLSQYARLGHKITVTAIVVKAIAIAQKDHPESRSVLLPWGGIVTFNHIKAGFTVEKFVDGKPTVFFGAIQEPDVKSLEEIAQELRDYSERPMCDTPQLNLEDRFSRMPWLLRRMILWLGLRFPKMRLRCLGATFGVSSLGKYGIRTLIPPCVCTSTFGVGTVEERAVINDGQIVVKPMMTLALNFDHRLIDGAPAARFMADVRKLIEGDLAKYVDAASSTSSELPLVLVGKSPGL